jgi:hypothetical protein
MSAIAIDLRSRSRDLSRRQWLARLLSFVERLVVLDPAAHAALIAASRQQP